MTEPTKTIRRLRAPLTAAVAGLALAGCAATHVGEDWQCPLAQGSQCASVAAADPAVRDAAGAGRMARTAPLYRAPDAAEPHALPAVEPDLPERDRRRDCAAGCNPFAWFARLFAGGVRDTEGGGADGPASIDETEGPAPETAVDVEPVSTPGPQPDAQAPSEAGDASADALRAPETIGRIWIAPYVDADGVYREGSYVRIVLAPADWKRP